MRKRERERGRDGGRERGGGNERRGRRQTADVKTVILGINFLHYHPIYYDSLDLAWRSLILLNFMSVLTAAEQTLPFNNNLFMHDSLCTSGLAM